MRTATSLTSMRYLGAMICLAVLFCVGSQILTPREPPFLTLVNLLTIFLLPEGLSSLTLLAALDERLLAPIQATSEAPRGRPATLALRLFIAGLNVSCF